MKIINSSKIKIKTNLPFCLLMKITLFIRLLINEKKYQINNGIYINLSKRIPVSAGMAGGSTDAAAALIGMDRLFGLNLTLEELMDVGVTLGADVPYCLMGGTALSEGIGEKLTPLPAFPNCHILIVKPNINVSTKKVYSNLDLSKVQNRPNIDGIIDGIKKNDLYEATRHFDNVLESVTIGQYNLIDDIKMEMIDQGAITSLMSGSGPTVFGIFDDLKLAKDAFYHFKVSNFKYQVFLTKPKGPVFKRN